jgi:Transposase domain (DUF772)
VFSSRKLERATYDSVAFRFIAANDHPDHDTIAAFRRRFLKEIDGLFVQVLLLAREMGRPVGRPADDVRRPGELYPRVGFIVTNMSRPAENVAAFYNKRGTREQWIKEGKCAVRRLCA